MTDGPRHMPDRFSLIAMLTGGAILGFAAPLIRLSGEDIGPQSILFWRYFFSLGPLVIWFLLIKGNTRPNMGFNWILILAGIFFALDMTFWNVSILITTISNAVLFANLAGLPVAVGAWFLFKERLALNTYMGGIAALTGAAILTGANFAIAPDRLQGDVFAMIAAFGYAGYILCIRSVRAKITAFNAALWVSLSGMGVAVISVIMASEVATERFLPDMQITYLYLVLLGIVHILGQGLIIYGLGRVSATLGAIAILTQPVISTLLAWIFFGEALNPIQMGGAVILLAGIWLAQRPRPKTRH